MKPLLLLAFTVVVGRRHDLISLERMLLGRIDAIVSGTTNTIKLDGYYGKNFNRPYFSLRWEVRRDWSGLAIVRNAPPNSRQAGSYPRTTWLKLET